MYSNSVLHKLVYILIHFLFCNENLIIVGFSCWKRTISISLFRCDFKKKVQCWITKLCNCELYNTLPSTTSPTPKILVIIYCDLLKLIESFKSLRFRILRNHRYFEINNLVYHAAVQFLKIHSFHCCFYMCLQFVL